MKKRKRERGAVMTEMALLGAGLAVAVTLAVTHLGINSQESLCESSNTLDRDGSQVQPLVVFVPGQGCFSYCPFGPGACCGLDTTYQCPP